VLDVIRNANLSDAMKIAELMLEHPLWQSSGLSQEKQAEKLYSLLMDTEKHAFVAEEEDSLIGFVLFDLHTFGKNGYIQLIGVRFGLTGSKIGDQLLKTAHEVIKQTVSRCFLLCTSTNTGAQKFYERHGYNKVGELQNWLKSGVDEYIFCNPNL